MRAAPERPSAGEGGPAGPKARRASARLGGPIPPTPRGGRSEIVDATVGYTTVACRSTPSTPQVITT